MKHLATYLNPFKWRELSCDRELSAEWGRSDAFLSDDLSRQAATRASLILLLPATHDRYWAAYDAARTYVDPTQENRT